MFSLERVCLFLIKVRTLYFVTSMATYLFSVLYALYTFITLILCASEWMFVSLKTHIESLILIWRWGFWKVIYSCEWSPPDGISIPTRKHRRKINCFSTMWRYSKVFICKPGRRSSLETKLLAPWSWTSQTFRIVRNKCCLTHIVYGICCSNLSWLRHWRKLNIKFTS